MWLQLGGLLLLVTAAVPPARGDGGPGALTVEECVALARRAAPAVRAAGLDRAAARADSSGAAVGARPTVSLLAGATIAPAWSYDPVLTNLGDYELKLSLDWTASDGGRLARARTRSGIDLRASDQRLAIEIRDAGLSAARLAIEVLRMREEADAQRQSAEWLDRLAGAVRAGVSAGTRGPADSTRVDLERDAVTNALESAELDVRTATLELGSLLGVDGASLVVRDSADAEQGPRAADSTALLSRIEHLPEVELARALAERSRVDLADAEQARAPQVSVTLDAGLAGADLTHAVPPELKAGDPDATFADRLRRDVGASAAVHLRLPVLDAALSPAARGRKAASDAEAVRGMAEAARQREASMTLLARWSASYRRVVAARQTFQRAEANLLRAKSLYSAGALRLLDLLDSRQVHEEARRRLADARAENRMLQIEAEERR